MSCACWTTDGFGIRVSDLELKSDTCLYDLVCMDDVTYNRISEKSGCKTKEAMCELINDRDKLSLCIDEGVAGILSNVIEANENFYMLPVETYLGEEYLLYMPSYPWSARSKEEDDLNPDKLSDIIKKYVKVISDTEVTPQYLSVEDCG